MHGRLMGAIGILLMGLFLASGVSAQATPTLVCGEKQAINSITGPYVPLVFIQGTPGTASVGGVTVNTMTNAHAEDATAASPFYNTGVEIGCKLQNAGGVQLFNTTGSGATTVLHLSGNTNAHAELPSQTNYTTNIILRASSGSILVTEHIGTACAANETELIHLSGSTNAHTESTHYSPAAYTTRICLSYSSTGAGPITDIVSASIGISIIPGSTGSSTPYNFTVGQATNVYVNGVTTKTAPVGTTQTRTEGYLVLCIQGDADCDTIASIDGSNPINIQTVLSTVLSTTSNHMIVLGHPFDASSTASLLTYLPANPNVTLAPFPAPFYDLENQTTPGIGLTSIPGAGTLNTILSTGSYSGINALPNVPGLITAGGYTMRVIAIAFPALTTQGAATLNEFNIPGSTVNNIAASTIHVAPAGSATTMDIANVQVQLLNFTGAFNAGTTQSPAPILKVITRINAPLLGNATNVSTMTAYLICRTDDTTAIAAGTVFPSPYNTYSITNWGQLCASINEAGGLFTALQVSPILPTPLAPASFGPRKIIYFGDPAIYTVNPVFTQTWLPVPGTPLVLTNFFNTQLGFGTPPQTLDQLFGTGVDTYALNALPQGNYRLLAGTFPTVATVGGNSVQETPPIQINPGAPVTIITPADMANNFAAVSFSVLPPGVTPTTCNNNNICEPALGEDPVTCPNDCKIGTPGDVYLLKDVSIPQHYKGEKIDVSFTVESKKAAPNNTILNWQVKDKDGNPVAGLQGQVTLQFSGTLTGGKESITTPAITLEDPANPIVFNAGETYTVYAKVQAYDNPINNVPPGNILFDESVIANNSAFKTFTVPQPPQNFNIPDQPWWMSLVVVFAFAGWMLISLRNAQ